MSVQKNGISTLIVCYHEEALIERALISVKDCTDEIIVIHDGPCSDKTVEIAKKYTNKVYVTEIHKGIGESWYIMGFKLCTSKWILRIDADEYLSTDLQKHIRKLTQSGDVDAYSFIWPMWDGEKYISFKALRKNFLFRKSKIGFIDKFHYPIKVLGTICNSNYIVDHKPQYNNWTRESFNKKLKKWALLHAKDHIVPVDDREVLNLRIDELKNEQRRKNLFYKVPVTVFVLTYLAHLKRILTQPQIIFDRGYWITGIFSAKYSYEVAVNVSKLLKNNEPSKILRK